MHLCFYFQVEIPHCIVQEEKSAFFMHSNLSSSARYCPEMAIDISQRQREIEIIVAREEEIMKSIGKHLLALLLYYCHNTTPSSDEIATCKNGLCMLHLQIARHSSSWMK